MEWGDEEERERERRCYTYLLILQSCSKTSNVCV